MYKRQVFVINADANPLSNNSVVVESVDLSASIINDDFICGSGPGVYNLGILEVPLQTGTPAFVAIRIDDPLGPYPIPGEDMVVNCPESGGGE